MRPVSDSFGKSDRILWLDMVKYFRGDNVVLWFEKRLEALQIVLSAAMMKQFSLYHDFLTQKNAVMNLTAITGEEEIYRKHFLDSLFLKLAFFPKNQSLLDVGSGAGFPSLPLKIIYPELKVTIIDSLDKRIHFLTELVTLLGMKDVTLIHGRAEELSSKNAFDLVTARAVARLNILTELCLPFVKQDGLFIAMKSADYAEEMTEAMTAIKTLGGTIVREIPCSLDDETTHTLIVIRKTKLTDDRYPRSYSQIKKKPL
jgi:16S rRNA (guanine527-N7)-methyltransferase